MPFSSCSLYGSNTLFKVFLYVSILERGRQAEVWGRERETLIFVLFIGVFIGWFLCEPWLGIEPAILVHLDDALTHCATWPGPQFL